MIFLKEIEKIGERIFNKCFFFLNYLGIFFEKMWILYVLDFYVLMGIFLRFDGDFYIEWNGLEGIF